MKLLDLNSYPEKLTFFTFYMFNTIRIFHFVAIENIQLKYLLLLISHNIING